MGHDPVGVELRIDLHPACILCLDGYYRGQERMESSRDFGCSRYDPGAGVDCGCLDQFQNIEFRMKEMPNAGCSEPRDDAADAGRHWRGVADACESA